MPLGAWASRPRLVEKTLYLPSAMILICVKTESRRDNVTTIYI